MASIDIDVNAKAADELAADIGRAKRQLIGRLAERGYQLLVREIPVSTGNLKQGVAPPATATLTGKHRTEAENRVGFSIVDFENAEASLTVSARSARIGPRQAVVIGADGEEKRRVTLKPVAAFNYAESVARGRPSIAPKIGRALLIPVPLAPSGESYLVAGGKIFVVRRSAKAVPPNPFDERAAKRLEGEADQIADSVLRKIFV